MSQHITTLRDFTTKRVIKQFVRKHHMVYFGYVDPREDEHELVRGITVATSHTDNHYSVGTFNGHDITLVERRNTLKFPGKPDASYAWLIMQVDLRRKGLPHVFIDLNHHDPTFYANLSVGFVRLHDLSSLFPEIRGHARVLGSPENYQVLRVLLTEDIMKAIYNFRQFDYEINDDQLFVYASNPTVISTVLLDDMLRGSMWLADYINALVKNEQATF